MSFSVALRPFGGIGLLSERSQIYSNPNSDPREGSLKQQLQCREL